MTQADKLGGKSLALLQVNCRSIYNKALEFWNLVDTYNPDIIIGTESWLREEIGNTEIFRTDFTTFRRDRHARGGGVFICVKNNITCSELWVDDDFEIIAVEVRGSDPKDTWEIVGIYRAPNEDVRVIERLADRTGFLTNSMKQSIIGGDLNLPQVDWKGVAEGNSVTQAFINRLVWDNGYTQVVGKPTRGDSLLDVYLIRPESALISCSTVQGISDHCGVLLEVEWIGSGVVTQQKRSVLAYHKTDVLGLQSFLWDKLPTWANNGSCVEDIWNKFKDIIFEGIERFVPHKILKQNPDPEYYSREVKRLKVKVRRAYNRRKLGEHYQQELKRLSQKLLAAKRNAQETFLRSVLQNEGKSWAEFYRYVKRRKGNRENIPMIRDSNGGHITDPVEKANNLNNYYASVFSCERDIAEIKTSHVYEPFTVKTSIIRKRLAMIRRNKSVGPDDIPGDILKMGGEAMISYLARLLDISINNGTIPGDWKKAIVVPVHKGGDRSAVQNYRPVSLTSVVCKHMEHVIAGYMRQVWENSDWLYEGQHGFRPGFSCESQIITVCQDISDSLDEATRLDAIIIDFSKAFDRVPHDRLLKKIADSGVDPRVVVWIREFLVGRSQRVRVGGQLSDEVRVTSGVPQGSVLGPLLFLAYVNDIWRNIESKIRLFADDCIVYRKIVNNYDVEKLQTDLDRLGDWAVENEMKINPSKSKSISFTRARIKDPLNYTLRDQKIPEDSCCKYLGIIIRSDLSWADQVNHTVQKAWRALHFVMRIVKKGNKNTKSIAYKSLVRPILEYGAACWDPYRECQINTLDRVQNKAAKFAHQTGGSEWESLAQRRKIARLCALYKAYTGERSWKAIRDRLQAPSYLSRVDHNWKIRARKQRTDVGKYSFVNRTITDWNQLTEGG